MNQLGESLPNFIFAVVNLDPIVLEKRWTDGESWPYDFVEKVSRGEDLRWVGSRWPLTHALMFLAFLNIFRKGIPYFWTRTENCFYLVVLWPVSLLMSCHNYDFLNISLKDLVTKDFCICTWLSQVVYHTFDLTCRTFKIKALNDKDKNCLI